MHITENVGTFDCTIRLLCAEFFVLAGFFWLPFIWPPFAYVLALILAITSFVQFCPLYLAFHISTVSEKQLTNKKGLVGMLPVAIFILALGSYASSFFTKKFFLEDYNFANQYYKQALFQTGKNSRAQALENYNVLAKVYLSRG